MEVKHLTPKWDDDLAGTQYPGLVANVTADERGNLTCTLAFKVRGEAKRAAFNFPCIVGSTATQNLAGETVFCLMKLGPSTWAVFPAVFAEGRFHAYITMRDVPEPAPFEPNDDEEDEDVEYVGPTKVEA